MHRARLSIPWIVSLAGLLCLAPGCSSSSAPTGEAAKTADGPTRQAIGEAEVKGLVDQWLAAQNAGDFKAYEALYASKFEGVKRSGDRATRFRRDGWMKDRGRMFEKKMAVEAGDLKIAVSSGSAVAGFTQTWESGTYRDVGPKQLVVAREGGALKIAREEMLASKKLGAKEVAPLPVDQFAHVVHGGGKSWVLLKLAPLEAWGQGAPAVLKVEAPVAVRRAVNMAALPPELAGLKGQKLQLYQGGAPACQASIKELVLLGRAVPHFGTMDAWTGQLDEKPSAAEIATQAWEMTADARYLAGELEGAGCGEADWARSAALPAPAVAPVQPASGRGLEVAVETLRKLPAWTSIQKDYRRYQQEMSLPQQGLWDEFDGAKPSVFVIGKPEEGRVLISATARAQGTCAEFGASLWAVWEVTGLPENPRFTLLNEPAKAADMVPAAAFDVDGDGRWEMLHHEGLLQQILRSSGTRYDVSQGVLLPDYDCPC